MRSATGTSAFSCLIHSTSNMKRPGRCCYWLPWDTSCQRRRLYLNCRLWRCYCRLPVRFPHHPLPVHLLQRKQKLNMFKGIPEPGYCLVPILHRTLQPTTSLVIGDAHVSWGTMGHHVCIGFCTTSTELTAKTVCISEYAPFITTLHTRNKCKRTALNKRLPYTVDNTLHWKNRTNWDHITDSQLWLLDPPAAEYPPNSPKKHRWPKIRRKKMRLAENPPNRKFAAAAEKNCGYCGAFNTTGCWKIAWNGELLIQREKIKSSRTLSVIQL